MFKVKVFTVLIAIIAFGIAPASATMVTFQVNMTVQTDLGNFVPASDSVFIRGAFQGWSGYTHRLADGDADGIYTGEFDIAARPDTAYGYKFVLVHEGTDTWESLPNDREVTVGSDPITLPVVFFSDVQAAFDCEVFFQVDMSVQILTNNFEPEADWIVVRGGHPAIGSWGGATRLFEETGNPGVFSAWIEFDDVALDPPTEYKFVILHDGDVNDGTGWEQLPGNVNRSFDPTGDEPDNFPPPNGNGYAELPLDLVYYGDVGPDDVITQDVDVIFQVEITPLLGRLADQGFVVDVQTGDTVFSVQSIQVAGPSPYLNNWPWGNFAQEYFLNDNGTNGDLAAGDDVWAVTIPMLAGTPREITYKYGANQYDVEAGVARNHNRTLDDSEPTFRFDIDCWGSPDVMYAGWPCLISDADDSNVPVISDFALEQNFPNPFNPSTTIAFNLTQSNLTSLKVFDVLGRTVGTIDMGRMSMGRHTVSFDGSNLSSGVYFYQLESGAFTAIRKMLLLK